MDAPRANIVGLDVTTSGLSDPQVLNQMLLPCAARLVWL